MIDFTNESALEALSKNPLLIILITAGVLSALSIIPKIRQLLTALLREFFYSERNSGTRATKELQELQQTVHRIEKELSKGVLKDREQIVADEISRFVDDTLPELLQSRTTAPEFADRIINTELDSRIAKTVSEYLISRPITDFAKDAELFHTIQSQERRAATLSGLVEEQLRNAGRMKTVMINLFILFNLAIIALVLTMPESLSSGSHSYGGALALYISLATFIFYIYRTSNARTLTLIALREDAKKLGDAIIYVLSVKRGKDLTETDIEFLRLLLTNRAERERPVLHPYEIILKGINDSNILFRGGKISFEKKSATR